MLLPFWPLVRVQVNISWLIVLIVMAYMIAGFFKDKSPLNKSLLIILLSGFFWTIPMRNFVGLHEFQSVFYVGFGISLYTILLTRLSQSAWKFLAVDVALLFIVSVAESNLLRSSPRGMNATTEEFQTIVGRLHPGSRVYIDGGIDKLPGLEPHEIDFFLSNRWLTARDEAEYVISRNTNHKGKKLTSNPDYNLFKVAPESP